VFRLYVGSYKSHTKSQSRRRHSSISEVRLPGRGAPAADLHSVNTNWQEDIAKSPSMLDVIYT
jgi:hypothetical protein